MNTSALASTLPGVTAWPGSIGKFGPTSIKPPMKGLSTCQSWMLEVPSILILLPDLADKGGHLVGGRQWRRGQQQKGDCSRDQCSFLHVCFLGVNASGYACFLDVRTHQLNSYHSGFSSIRLPLRIASLALTAVTTAWKPSRQPAAARRGTLPSCSISPSTSSAP